MLNIEEQDVFSQLSIILTSWLTDRFYCVDLINENETMFNMQNTYRCNLDHINFADKGKKTYRFLDVFEDVIGVRQDDIYKR